MANYECSDCSGLVKAYQEKCNHCGSDLNWDFLANYECSDCGGLIKEGQKKCKHCGAELVWNNISSVQKDNTPRCPSCGSSSIHIGKQGYDPSTGCCGYFLCGPLGFLLGQANANKLRKTCLNCNKSWR